MSVMGGDCDFVERMLSPAAPSALRQGFGVGIEKFPRSGPSSSACAAWRRSVITNCLDSKGISSHALSPLHCHRRSMTVNLVHTSARAWKIMSDPTFRQSGERDRHLARLQGSGKIIAPSRLDRLLNASAMAQLPSPRSAGYPGRHSYRPNGFVGTSSREQI